MEKKRIIDKIVSNLPTCDLRSKMSHNQWYDLFEEAYDKGYAEALRQPPTDILLSFLRKVYKDLEQKAKEGYEDPRDLYINNEQQNSIKRVIHLIDYC